MAKNDIQTPASSELVTAFASEVMWVGDAQARGNREGIQALMNRNRDAGANTTVDDITQTLTRQATLVERIAGAFSLRVAATSDPSAAAILAKVVLSAVRTLVQIESARFQLLRERNAQDS